MARVILNENAILNYQLITTNDELKKVCERACHYDRVALDTEFVRTRTYYPQLGLIQLYDGESLALIDPLGITDWQPFTHLLKAPNVLKLLHAGSEDLEVFLHDFQMLPEPMIDTQVLAAFTGRPLSTGFAALVQDYLGVALDKSESRTDWLARPLTERQCVYAAADVFYLLPLAQQLIEQVSEAGWMAAAEDECRMICRRRREVLQPEEAYKDFSNVWQLRTRQLACLKALAAWRLTQARERDMAVNFVVREENLWQVARYMPTSLGELDKLGISGQEIRYHGKTLVALANAARELPESEWPEAEERLIDHPKYKRAFKELKAEVQNAAQRSGLSAELIASRRQINQVLSWFWLGKNEQPELLQGWRETLLGDALRATLDKL